MRTDHRVHTCGGDMDTPCGGDMSMDYGYAAWGLCGQTTRYTVMRIMPCGGSVLDEVGNVGGYAMWRLCGQTTGYTSDCDMIV